MNDVDIMMDNTALIWRELNPTAKEKEYEIQRRKEIDMINEESPPKNYRRRKSKTWLDVL